MAFNVLTQKMSVLAPGAPALRASLSSSHAARSRAPFAVCGAVRPSEDERSPAGKLALPFAGALAAALILGAALPEDALAARSGGRVGGSSFRSSAPSRGMPRSGGGGGGGGGGATINRNYNYYGGPSFAPPLVGGYGYGGGFFAPSLAMPVYGIGGGFFSFVFFMFAVSAVFGVVRGLFNRNRNNDFDD